MNSKVRAQIAAAKKKAKQDWLHQRNKAFLALCSQSGLPVPLSEYHFAASIGRKWRIDYYFESACLGLEVEGMPKGEKVVCPRCNQTVTKKIGDKEFVVYDRGGRHTQLSGYLKDIEKYNHMAFFGIRLIRIPAADLLKISTIETIRKAIMIK